MRGEDACSKGRAHKDEIGSDRLGSLSAYERMFGDGCTGEGKGGLLPAQVEPGHGQSGRSRALEARQW